MSDPILPSPQPPTAEETSISVRRLLSLLLSLVDTNGNLKTSGSGGGSITNYALETGGNLASLLATLGATTGAAVITDANGTAQQYLRGLVKLHLAGITANAGTNLNTSALALETTQQSCLNTLNAIDSYVDDLPAILAALLPLATETTLADVKTNVVAILEQGPQESTQQAVLSDLDGILSQVAAINDNLDPIAANTANTAALLAKATAANTPSILTSGGDVLAANGIRKSWSIQNLGTNTLFVRLGTGASSSVFHRVLKGGTLADDALGGVIEDDTYTGIVSATGTSPRFVVTELQ